MRKIVAILIFVITCISYAGHFYIYTYQIHQATEQAAFKKLQQLPDNLLIKISDAPTLNWEENDELWVDNQLLDVVKRVSENGQTYLMCVADADEAAAIKKLAALTHSDIDLNGKDGVKIKNKLDDILFKFADKENENLTAFATATFFNDYSPALNSTCGSVLVPPPKSQFVKM